MGAGAFGAAMYLLTPENLIVVPLVLGGFMAIYRRSYLMPLFTDPRGITMLVVGAALFVLGIIWMTRVIRVEA